jgi:hypothetical protein
MYHTLFHERLYMYQQDHAWTLHSYEHGFRTMAPVSLGTRVRASCGFEPHRVGPVGMQILAVFNVTVL